MGRLTRDTDSGAQEVGNLVENLTAEVVGYSRGCQRMKLTANVLTDSDGLTETRFICDGVMGGRRRQKKRS